MCVFGITVLKIFVERWFWELKMLIGSLVKLHAWLHSYLCFSLLEKWFLSNPDTSWIPPQHLAICRALKDLSYHNLDRSSTASGSNEKVPGLSIASWHLMDRSSLNSCVWCFVPRHLLDSCICQLCFSRHLPQQMARHLSTPLSVENYWGSIYSFFAIWFSFLSISLSIPLSLHLPKHLFSLPTSTKVIFKLFQGFFYTW